MDNSELFSDFVPDTQLAQTQAVTGANGNPDSAAKALDISKKTGVPASVAEPNLDQFYQQWKQKSASTAVQSNPAAAGYVASNPMAAKVSGDDWDNLQRSSKTLNSYTDGNMHSALINGPLQAIRRLAGAFEGAKEGVGDKPLSEAISPEDWANHPVWATVLSPLIYGIEGAKKATGAGIGAASGYSYYWAKDAGMSDADAGKFARDIGIFATGAMVESGIGPKMPHFTPGGELPELKVTPEAAQSVAAGEVPRPGADPTFDQLHQIQQKVDSVKVGQMVEDAEASKTRDRSPEMYSQFVKEHGTENETISIPAETIRDLYLTEGKSLDDPKGPMAYVNDLGNAVKKGLDSGTEVKIPLSDYVANTDSALHAKLADSIRFREDGVTGEEAKELGKAKETEEPKEEIATLPDKMDESAKSIALQAIQAKDALYLNPLFKDAKTFGLTETEFKRYSNLIENSQNEIIARSIAASEREIKKPLTEEWKKNEKATRFQAEKETLGRPEIAADRFLRSGELPDGKRVKLEGKLNAESVTEALGKDHALEDLTQAKGGVLPDDISLMLGFDSGKAMLKALDEFNQGQKKQGLAPKAYLDRIVDKETQDRMRAQYGFLPDKILVEARDIALNNIQGELFDTEIRALAKQGGFDLPVSKEVLQDKARNDFAALTMDKIPTEAELRRAIEKGGRNAEKALLKGNFEDALKAKMTQRQAYWFHRELKDFQRDDAKLDRDISRIKNDDSVKKYDSVYIMQARRLLDGLGVNAGKFDPASMKSFSDFVQNSDGRIATASWLNEGLRTSLDQLTTEEVRDLQKTMQSIMHNARDANRFDTAYARMELDEVFNRIDDELSRFDTIEQLKPKLPLIRRLGVGARQGASLSILSERILDYTDKYNPRGVFSQIIDRPLREAFGQKLKYQEAIRGDIKELGKHVDNSVTSIIDNNLIRDPFNDNQLLQMNHWGLRKLMLYMGSKSGAEKAVRGFFEHEGQPKLEPMELDYYTRQIEKLVSDNATAKDVGFVNKMFDIHEKLLPDIKKLELEYTGIPMDEVTARPYKTDAGDVKGGYHKISYDKWRSNIEETIRGDKSWFDGDYQRISTPHNFTQKRTGYAGFVDLDMTRFAGELDSVIHDLSFRNAIANAGKVIGSDKFKIAMGQKWGTEYADLFSPWLRDTANAQTIDVEYAKGWVRTFAALRQQLVSTLTGLNAGTAEKHGISAAAMSAWEVGPANLVKNAVTAITKSGKELAETAAKVDPEVMEWLKAQGTERNFREYKFALNSSVILRNRVMRYGDTIYGAARQATDTGYIWNKFRTMQEWSQYIGRWPLSKIDGFSTVPEWLAAYKNEMNISGDHSTAVYAADKAVSRSHGSSFIGDSPAIIRQKNTPWGEAMRWIMPMYKFWDHNLNLAMGLKWDLNATIKGREEPRSGVAMLAQGAFWGMIIPMLAEEVAKPINDQDKHGASATALLAMGRYFGSWFPVIRDISNGLLHGYEPSVGFLSELGKVIYKGGHELIKGSANQITNVGTLFSAITGIGSQPAAKAVQYGAHVLENRERPGATSGNTAVDIMQGLRTGSQRPRRY